MNTLQQEVTTASIVVKCTSITRTDSGYSAECTFSRATGPITINDQHEPPPVHVLTVCSKEPVNLVFSVDQTALPAGYSAITVTMVQLPPNSPLTATSANTISDPCTGSMNGTLNSFWLVLEATPSGGGAAIKAIWDPGIENDAPPY